MGISVIELLNFRSFVGYHKICLTNTAALMCLDERGKQDFVSSLQFALGADISDFGFEHPYDFMCSFSLFSKPPNAPISLFVEISVTLDRITFYSFRRSIENGTFKYSVEEEEVTSKTYTEKLNDLGFDASDIFIDKSLYDIIMWHENGVEHGLVELLKVPFFMETICHENRMINCHTTKEEFLKEAKFLMLTKELKSVEIVADKVRNFSQYLKNRFSRLITSMHSLIDELSSLMISATPADDNCVDVGLKQVSQIDIFVDQEIILMEQMAEARKKHAALEAQLFCKMKQIGKVFQSELVDVEIEKLSDKKKILENELTNLTFLKHATQNNLNEVHKVICQLLNDIEAHSTYKISLSPYGRVSDYFSGKFSWLLMFILGDEVYNAHIFDNLKTPIQYLQLLKEKMVITRESFLMLDIYSPKLLDLLFTPDPNILDTVQEIQNILAYLKTYNLIHQVPTFVLSGEMPHNFSTELPMVIFVDTGEYATGDGLFGRLDMGESGKILPLNDALLLLTESLEQEEDLFDYLRIQNVKENRLKWEIHALSEETTVLEAVCPTRRMIFESPDQEIPPIYEDYLEFFHTEFVERPTTDLELPIAPGDSVTLAAEFEESVKKYDKVSNEINQLDKSIIEVRKLIRQCFVNICVDQVRIRKPFILGLPLKDKHNLSIEIQLNELINCINNDDLDQFFGGNEWRKSFLKKLTDEIKKEMQVVKTYKTALNNLNSKRKENLSSAVSYFNENIGEKMRLHLGAILSNANLSFDKKDFTLNLHLSFYYHNLHFNDSNTFIRAIAMLAMILNTANYQGRTTLVLDDFENFFPRSDNDVGSALGVESLEMRDTRLKLSSKIGFLLNSFVAKEQGLHQMLQFTLDDIAETADTVVVIFLELLEDPKGRLSFSCTLKNVDFKVECKE